MSAFAATIDVLCPDPAASAAGSRARRDWRPWAAATDGNAEATPQPAAVEAVDPADLADVGRAVEGDGDAYARLVRRHQAAIGTYMWRFSRDRTEWEELVHEVFVEAYLSLRSFRGRAPLSHWLRKIATRVGYRYWTKRGKLRVQSETPPTPLDQIEEPTRADSREAAEQVHAVLQRMSPRDRLVLTLFYLEECPIAEIARLTGWSQTMVKVQSFRARNRLKKLLENEQ